MLLTQRIEEMDLPSAEKTAANYLLAQGSKLKGRSTRKIATDAYTPPPPLSASDRDWDTRDGLIFLRRFLKKGNIWKNIFRM